MKKICSAFTLIEMMLSVIIMAVIAQGTYELMSGVFSTSETVQDNTDTFHHLEKAINLMDNDFPQIVPRETRLSGTSTRSTMAVGETMFESEGTGITFVRGGALNPGGLLPRGEVIRVWYRFKEGKLQRAVYPYPDTVVSYEPEFETILEKVKKFRIYFFKQGMWSMGWQNKATVPKGIKVEIETEDFGVITRIYYAMAGS